MDHADPRDRSTFRPFIPVETDLPELTFKAVALGAVMAIILGAANAYLGMRAGLTVCGDLPGSGSGNGAASPMGRVGPRRKHRPDHRLSRRGAGRRRDLHDSRVRHQRRLG